MQQADFQRFHALMHGMAKVYERELDELLLDAYWLCLRDWSYDEFALAAAHQMLTSKFMPRPADFNDLRKAAQPTAGEAWLNVIAHCRGGYRNGGGVSPDIDRIVAMLGGYRTLAMMPTDELHWQEKRFTQHFEELADVTTARQALGIDRPSRPRTPTLEKL